MLFFIHNKLIEKIDIFTVCSKIEVNFIVQNLDTTPYLPNDIVIRQGEEGDFIYFINKGSVTVSLNVVEVQKQNHLKSARQSE